MARASSWSRLKALEKRNPARDPDFNITGIIRTGIDPATRLICWIGYKSCLGHSSEYDDLEAEFDPPLSKDELPEPWRTLCRDADERLQRRLAKSGGLPAHLRR